MAEESVSSEAARRAATRLALSDEELSGVVASNKAGQIDQEIVRLFVALDVLSAGEERYARDWIRAENVTLNGVPLELMRRPGGLSEVVGYLESQIGHD